MMVHGSLLGTAVLLICSSSDGCTITPQRVNNTVAAPGVSATANDVTGTSTTYIRLGDGGNETPTFKYSPSILDACKYVRALHKSTATPGLGTFEINYYRGYRGGAVMRSVYLASDDSVPLAAGSIEWEIK